MTDSPETTSPIKAAECHVKFQVHFTQTFSNHKLCKDLTTQAVAESVGVDRKTVEKWIRGESAAQGGSIIALAILFGADFLEDLFRPFGFSGVQRIEYGNPNPFIVNSSLARALATLSNALQDHRIDHTETPEVLKNLERAVREAEALHRQLSSS